MRWIFLFLFLMTTHCSTPPQPKVADKKEEPPKVDRKQIIRTIKSHRKYMSSCYGKVLTKQGNAKLKGTVMVHFKVGPDGKAFDPKMVKERSTLQDPELNKCLFAGITSWDFPVHADGEEIEIKYPFGFRDNTPANMQDKMDRFEKIRGH